MQVCEAISGSKSAAYTMKVLVPLVSPLMVTTAMQPGTFSKYMSFMRAALQRCEDQAAAAPQSSNHSASSSSAVTTWDEPRSTGAAYVANIALPRGAGDGRGLGLGAADDLLDWSASLYAAPASSSAAPISQTPVRPMNANGATLPGSLAFGSTAPPPTAGEVQGLRVAPKHGPQVGAAGNTSQSQGMRTATGMSMQSSVSTTQSTSVGLPHGVTPLAMGHSANSSRQGPGVQGVAAQLGGMSVGMSNSDPFADLLGTSMTMPAAPAQGPVAATCTVPQPPQQWDPFA